MVIRKDKSKFGHTSIFRKVEFLKSMKSEEPNHKQCPIM